MDDSTIIDVRHRRRDHEGDDGDGDGDDDYDAANVSTETPHMGDIDLETTAAGGAAVPAAEIMGDRDEHDDGGGGGGDGDGRGDDDDEHGAGGDGGDGGNGRITRVTVENGMGGENDGEDDDDDDDDDDDGVVEWEDFMADYWRMEPPSPPPPLPRSAATATAAGEDTDMRPCGMDPELDDERGPSSRIRDSDDERPRATGRDHRARSGLVDMDDTIVDDDSDDDCGFVGVEDLEALSRAGRDCSRAMADIVGIGGTTEGGKGGGDARGLRIDLGRRVVVASAGRRRCHRDGGGGDGATFPAAVGGGAPAPSPAGAPSTAIASAKAGSGGRRPRPSPPLR